MSLRLLLSSLPECFFLLRCAAWLVPGKERADWLAEWRAEVWHVWDSYGRSYSGDGSLSRSFSGCFLVEVV